MGRVSWPMAFYSEGGGTFEYSPDAKDGFPNGHLEPRYNLGAGFSFDASEHIEVDLGYRWQDMPPFPGRTHDTSDWSHSVYLELRYRPFRKE